MGQSIGIFKGIDATLSGSLPTTNDGTGITLITNTVTPADFVIKFDLSAIPVNATVKSATLVYTASASNGIPKLQSALPIKFANRGWTEGGVTWNTIDGVTSWAGSAGCSTAGTDYDNTTVLYSYTSTVLTVGQLETVPIGAFGLALLNQWVRFPATNFGCVVLGGDSGVQYASFNQGSPAAPLLTIDYEIESLGAIGRRNIANDLHLNERPKQLDAYEGITDLRSLVNSKVRSANNKNRDNGARIDRKQLEKVNKVVPVEPKGKDARHLPEVSYNAKIKKRPSPISYRRNKMGLSND